MPTLTSESVVNVLPALVTAQSAFGKAVKSAVNSHYGSSYTPLDAVLDAIVPALNANGLALTQHTTITEAGVLLLVTRFTHVTGEWVGSNYPILPSKADPQGYASALTYARRYTILALAGVAPTDEDDDGNSASRPQLRGAASPIPTKRARRTGPPTSSFQADALAADLADAIDGAATETRLDELVPSLQSLPAELRAPLRVRFAERRTQLRELLNVPST